MKATGATYDRPVAGKLVVELANGECWDAGPADLAKFGLVRALDAYVLVDEKLCQALEGLVDDIAAAELNPLRYLVEVCLCYPAHFEEFPEEMAELLSQVRLLEERLAGREVQDGGQQ